MYFIILGVNDEVRSNNFYFWSYKVFMKTIWFILSMRAKIPKIKNCERYTQILLRTPPHRDIFNDDVTLNKCRGKKEVFILQGQTHFSLLTKKISVITKLLLDVYRVRHIGSWSPIISDQITIMSDRRSYFSSFCRSWSWVIADHIFCEWSGNDRRSQNFAKTTNF